MLPNRAHELAAETPLRHHRNHNSISRSSLYSRLTEKEALRLEPTIQRSAADGTWRKEAGLTLKPLQPEFLPIDNAGCVVVEDIDPDNEALRLDKPEAITLSLLDSADWLVLDTDIESHFRMLFCTFILFVIKYPSQYKQVGKILLIVCWKKRTCFSCKHTIATSLFQYADNSCWKCCHVTKTVHTLHSPKGSFLHYQKHTHQSEAFPSHTNTPLLLILRRQLVSYLCKAATHRRSMTTPLWGRWIGPGSSTELSDSPSWYYASPTVPWSRSGSFLVRIRLLLLPLPQSLCVWVCVLSCVVCHCIVAPALISLIGSSDATSYSLLLLHCSLWSSSSDLSCRLQQHIRQLAQSAPPLLTPSPQVAMTSTGCSKHGTFFFYTVNRWVQCLEGQRCHKTQLFQYAFYLNACLFFARYCCSANCFLQNFVFKEKNHFPPQKNTTKMCFFCTIFKW